MTEAGNDKAGHARNSAIWRNICALDQVIPDTATPSIKLGLDRVRDELVRRYFANKREARRRGEKHLKVKCEFCGGDEQLHAHHINGNVWDNTPSNIGTLCGDCHAWIHSFMKDVLFWGTSRRRGLWYEVLRDASKGLLKSGYVPPSIWWICDLEHNFRSGDLHKTTP